MKTIKLLLIEDDANLCYMLKCDLEDDGGYEVRVASNGAEGLEELKTFNPDIIVSDIEMPLMDGLEMVKKIRQTNLDLPIVFATGRISPKDVKEGYDAGVDNYIKKPFTSEELDAHIKSLINLKTDNRMRLKNAIHQIGKYTFDPKNYLLTYNDTEKKRMTAKEAQILALLLEHKGEIVKRDDILKMFWADSDFFTSRSLDTFITKIRNMLAKDISVSINNVKGTGLILDVD